MFSVKQKQQTPTKKKKKTNNLFTFPFIIIMAHFADGTDFDPVEKQGLVNQEPNAVPVTAAAAAVTVPVMAAPVQQQHEFPKPWSTDLFACDDGNVCLESWFCTPCLAAKMYAYASSGEEIARLGPNAVDATGRPLMANSGDWLLPCLAGFAIDVLIGGGLGSFFVFFMARSKLRRRYNVEGNDLKDALLTFFCRPCSAQQAWKEMHIRGEYMEGMCYTSKYMPPAALAMGVQQQVPQQSVQY